MRHRMFQELPDAWKHAYEAGVFTEFMEQRAPGPHRGRRQDLPEGAGGAAGGHRPRAGGARRPARPGGVRQAAAAEGHAHGGGRRHPLRAAARRRGRAAWPPRRADPARRAELEQIAANCAHVPEHPARTFWEALQAYWFVHLGVITELNTWDSFCPGRLDQHLYPYYKREIEAGTLTRERAKELLQCFWVKFNNQPAPPKVGVTAAESGTYTDFSNISNGGLKADGSDGVNDVSYLILEVIDEMRLLQPSSNIQLSQEEPRPLPEEGVRGHPQGLGPAVGLQRRHGGGRTGAAGQVGRGRALRRHERLRRSGRVRQGELHPHRLLQPAEGRRDHDERRLRSAHRAADRAEDRRPGHLHRRSTQFLDAFRAQLQHFIDVKIAGSHIIERMYATLMPAPFLSIITDDCIKNGRGLQRRRRALQHALHHAGRPRHGGRQPVGDQVPRLRPPEHDDGRRWRRPCATTSSATSRCASCS